MKDGDRYQGAVEAWEDLGEPVISWGELYDGHPSVDVVILVDTVGISYGQLRIIFREQKT